MKGTTITMYITFALLAIGISALLLTFWKDLFAKKDPESTTRAKIWAVSILLGGVFLGFLGILIYFIFGGYNYFVIIFQAIGLGMIIASLLSGDTQVEFGGGRYSIFFNSMTFVSVLFVLIILIAINYIGYRRSKSYEFNEVKIQSLSDQTVKVLKGLKRPIFIIGFAYKDQRPIENAIRELLNKYKEQNRKMFNFKIVNPMDAPDLVECYGAKEVSSQDRRMIPLIVARGHCKKQDGKNVFIGKKIVIPDLSEQTITNKLIKVSREGQKEICFLTGRNQPSIDDKDSRFGYGRFKKYLEEKGFVTRSINLITQASIPKTCTVLVNAAPDLPVYTSRNLSNYSTMLSKPEINLIEEFLNKGGKALFFQEPQVKTGLEIPIRRFGIIVSQDLVVDFAVNYQGNPMRPLAIMFDHTHEITKGFTGRFRALFNFVAPVSVATGRPPGVVLTELAKTASVRFSRRFTNQSCCSFGVPDIRDPGFSRLIALARNWKAQTVLSNVARGIVPKLVKNVKVGPFSLAVAASKKIKGNGQEARLVVIGDSAFAGNMLIRTNSPFIMNTIAWLAQEKDLVHIPPKRRKPSKIFLTQTQRNIINYSSMYGIPGTFLFIILLVMAIRRQK